MRAAVVLGVIGAVLLIAMGFLGLQGALFDSQSSRVPVAEPAESSFHGATLNPPMPAPDFVLIDQHGNPYRLSDRKGKVVVLFFGYTTCPDVCPGTLVHYRQVKEQLGDESDRVEFVFVTVDPERDTTERLAEYVSIFDPEFVGLTGERSVLEQVWSDYGVYVERVDDPDSDLYWMNHTALSYVIDTRGDLRLTHLYGMPVEAVVEDLRRLL